MRALAQSTIHSYSGLNDWPVNSATSQQQVFLVSDSLKHIVVHVAHSNVSTLSILLMFLFCQLSCCQEGPTFMATAQNRKYNQREKNTAQYSIVQPCTAQNSPVRPSTAQYSSVQPSITQYNPAPPSTAQYNHVQLSIAQSNNVQECSILSYSVHQRSIMFKSVDWCSIVVDSVQKCSIVFNSVPQCLIIFKCALLLFNSTPVHPLRP